MDVLTETTKISLEENETSPNVCLVGESSKLYSNLCEIFVSRGALINSEQKSTYIFQLAEFNKINFFLEKAKKEGAKYFLILGDDQNPKELKRVQKKAFKFIESQPVNAKIIRVSGFLGNEIEAVERILRVCFSFDSQKIIEIVGPGVFLKTPKKSRKFFFNNKFFLWLIYTAIIIFLLSLPFLFILVNVFLGLFNLQRAEEAALASNFEQGKKLAQRSQEQFVMAENSFNLISPLFVFFGKTKEVGKAENLLSDGQNLSQATRHLINAGRNGQKLAKISFNQDTGSVKDILPALSDDISLAEEELSLIETRTKEPPFFKDKFSQIKKIRKNLSMAKDLLRESPWILGLKGKRTYLLLLQNNLELRPGGGFIGSIGILTFEDGKMDLKIEDVYTADGQLKGHVDPPGPIRDYLDQIHWYLRDSNWEPDFPVNAQRAIWFFEKEMGIKVDGVVAIDLNFAKKILSLTGPIELRDYKEHITTDNLFQKATAYSQEKFFPGSTQKKDFLGSLSWTVFEKILSDKNFPLLGLTEIIDSAVEEKHLLFYFDEESIQKLIKEQNFAGEIKSPSCNSARADCFNDYLMVVDANLGVNKANYFLKRFIKKEVNFDNSKIASKITIAYDNTSGNSPLGGNYKNYLRILLPDSSVIEEIKVGGRIKDLEKDVNKTAAFGKLSTGFLVEVPVNTKQTVEIIYKNFHNFSNKTFVYQLFVQKQAGTDKDPFTLYLNSPWPQVQADFPSVAKGGTINYEGDLLIDRAFVIKFNK
jgi:hypothetical protein